MGSRPAGPVLIRGGGELASAAARLLFLAGFKVAVLEREAPLAVRRRVSLAEAVFSGAAVVEETAGRLVSIAGIRAAWETGGFVPVAVDPDGASLAELEPEVVVDGRMAKRALDTRIDQAAIVVGLGPVFVAGVDVHAVVETQRGASLGRVIWRGPAEPDTSVPSPVAGYAERRVLRAPRSGIFRGRCRIGDLVRAGEPVGDVDGTPVSAPIDSPIVATTTSVEPRAFMPQPGARHSRQFRPPIVPPRKAPLNLPRLAIRISSTDIPKIIGSPSTARLACT